MPALLYRAPLGFGFSPRLGPLDLAAWRRGDAWGAAAGREFWDPRIYQVDLAETVALSETLTDQQTLHVRLTESVALSEALGYQQTLHVRLVETVALSEALGDRQTLHVSLSETVTLTESLGVASREGWLSGDPSLVLRTTPQDVRTIEADPQDVRTMRATVQDVRTIEADAQDTRTVRATTELREIEHMAWRKKHLDSEDIGGRLLRNGAAHDLTGATLSLVLRTSGGARLTRVATIVDAEEGTWTYESEESDLPPGEYSVELQVTLSSGRQVTWPSRGTETLTVEKSL